MSPTGSAGDSHDAKLAQLRQDVERYGTRARNWTALAKALLPLALAMLVYWMLGAPPPGIDSLTHDLIGLGVTFAIGIVGFAGARAGAAKSQVQSGKDAMQDSVIAAQGAEIDSLKLWKERMEASGVSFEPRPETTKGGGDNALGADHGAKGPNPLKEKKPGGEQL